VVAIVEQARFIPAHFATALAASDAEFRAAHISNAFPCVFGIQIRRIYPGFTRCAFGRLGRRRRTRVRTTSKRKERQGTEKHYKRTHPNLPESIPNSSTALAPIPFPVIYSFYDSHEETGMRWLLAVTLLIGLGCSSNTTSPVSDDAVVLDDSSATADSEVGAETPPSEESCFLMQEVVKIEEKGPEGANKSREVRTYTYDEEGNETLYLYSSDEDFDGEIDSVVSRKNDYDEEGRNISFLTERLGDDDIVDHALLETWAYNAAGDLTETSDREDGDGDGVWERNKTTTNTYDTEGRLTEERVEMLAHPSPDALYRHKTSHTYDSKGHAIETAVEEDEKSDGSIDALRLTKRTFNDAGLEVLVTWEEDKGSDGTIDKRGQTSNTYNDAGLEVLVISEHDENADGTIDGRSQISSTYNDDGQLLTEDTFTGNEEAPIWNYRRLIEKSYDTYGNLSGWTISTDSDNDGAWNQVLARTWTYNAQGQILKEYEGHEFDGDGKMDRAETTFYTYDEDGNETEILLEIDKDGDGIIDVFQRTTTVYNAAGDITSMTVESLTDLAGVPYQLVRSFGTYDEDGNLDWVTFEMDMDADGNPEMSYTETFTWIPCANATDETAGI